ncbi:hypothetical protein [Rossellomorea marisflavi]|uniref:hypothetical protein n=1 Tax=Rossellomorea marisflavi TaxID=189381 RepID=UPI0034596A1E
MFEERNEIILAEKTDIQEGSTNPNHQLLSLCEQNIREECNGVYIKKARTLFDIGFYDHAVLEYWNRAMTDLKDKLTVYGLEHFPGELNLKIKTREDLDNNAKDIRIIEACHLLGIIDGEALVFLKHCLNVRNNFSAAHDTDSPIDPIEAINLIKNCVKYVLQRDVPSPAMTITDLLKYLQTSTFEVEHFEEIVKDQSTKVVESFARRVFNEYIDPQTTKEYRDNLKSVIGIVWGMLGDEVKSELGQKLMQLKLEDEVDKSLYAMDFLIQVQGVKFIPMAVRKHIFTKKAKELLEAHTGANNFYTEVTHAKELEALGFIVPEESLETYVKAIIFSYTGNPWGNSRGASPYVQAMIANLSTKGIEILLDKLETDTSYAWHFSSGRPIKRFKEVLDILQGKSNLLPKHKAKIDYLLKVKSLRTHFSTIIEQ